jgi:transposase
MDNASFHRSDRLDQLCAAAGVKLLYLPPYSPDLNPIEEFFAELKAFIKRNWQLHGDLPYQDFGVSTPWGQESRVQQDIFATLGSALKNYRAYIAR